MKRADRAQWRARVDRWKASGLSGPAFAAQLGCSAQSLYAWRDRLSVDTPRLEDNGSTDVSPLTLDSFAEVRPEGFVFSKEGFEMTLPSGVQVRVPVDFDSEALLKLIRILETK